MIEPQMLQPFKVVLRSWPFGQKYERFWLVITTGSVADSRAVEHNCPRAFQPPELRRDAEIKRTNIELR
jgi:hypothetical protein